MFYAPGEGLQGYCDREMQRELLWCHREMLLRNDDGDDDEGNVESSMAEEEMVGEEEMGIVDDELHVIDEDSEVEKDDVSSEEVTDEEDLVDGEQHGVLAVRANSHLRKLKQIASQISHEGQPLDIFTSNYRKVPFYNWNPPTRDTLVVSCKNNIDDQIKIDNFTFVESITQNDIDCNLAPADRYVEVTGNGQLRDNDVTHVPADGYVKVWSDRHVQTNLDFNLSPAD